MNTKILSLPAIFFFLGAWVFAATAAAQSSAMLLKAKTEAETKGYIFETSHDAIVAKAKKEGKLVVFTTQRKRAPLSLSVVARLAVTRPAERSRVPLVYHPLEFAGHGSDES